MAIHSRPATLQHALCCLLPFQALEAFRTALQLNPGSAALRSRVVGTERALREKAGSDEPTGALGTGEVSARERDGQQGVPEPGPASWATGLSQVRDKPFILLRCCDRAVTFRPLMVLCWATCGSCFGGCQGGVQLLSRVHCVPPGVG